MPDLGVSVGTADTKKGDLRRVPIPVIIDQIIKVLKQVQTLQHNNYIHGDIRETNVMIHPTTGTITIIDFDLLKPANRFNPNGMYNNPPENLILDNSSDPVTKLYDYTMKFYKYFFYVQDLFKAEEFLTEMSEADDRNQAYMERVKKIGVVKKFLATYDSFGLASTLLCLLGTLYPGSIAQPKATLKNSLSLRTTKNGVPYTETELDACTNAIYDMSHSVLLLLSKFRMDFRPNVDGVLETALSIQRELNERMSGTMLGNRVGGRRKTVKTRKSVHRQKK
jgi:serine/threonine protein kinase